MSATAQAPFFHRLHELFSAVFWPAAAGNVFWAICTLIVDPETSWRNLQTFYSLTTLIALVCYLTLNWVRDFHPGEPVVVIKLYWLAQAVHVVTIVMVSLAAHLNPKWIASASVVFFAFNAFGHWTAVYAAAKPQPNKCYLVVLHSVAALCCLASYLCDVPVIIPIVYAITLMTWLCLRWGSFKTLFSLKS